MRRIRTTRELGREPRLVLRFAVSSLVAFILVGSAISYLAVRQVRSRAETVATFHARFVADAVLAPQVIALNLSEPIGGSALAQLDDVVRSRILTDGRDVRVKIWNREGTVVYSDAHALIGRRFPEESATLRAVMDGETEAGVTDLDEEENVFERALASKLFATYVPLRDGSGRAVGVAEVYQRYAVIEGDARGLLGTLSAVFVVSLLLLYAVLMPIALTASRTLRDRNSRLVETAGQLEALLAREQDTVAELRRLDRMKSDFVSAASHELRTPLTGIIGSLRTLQQPDLSSDPSVRSELLVVARNHAERLFRQVRNLLRGAHLEEGGGVISIEDVELGSVLTMVMGDFPGSSSRVHAELSGMPLIRTDRQRLEEILSNLLENALKFSPAGSPVDLSANVVNGRLVMRVHDRGIGIAPEHAEEMFERFHQADQSVTRRFGGLGLGLHLVREMVAELGGTISVESAIGEGSTFTVSIPVERVHTAPATLAT
jgi:signal transduction histidine kinase